MNSYELNALGLSISNIVLTNLISRKLLKLNISIYFDCRPSKDDASFCWTLDKIVNISKFIKPFIST